jgi:ABC-type multidrug transport system fused ATPase/permease subunit
MMNGKGLRASVYLGVLGAMAVVIYTIIDRFNVTAVGTAFVTVVTIVMALSFALLIFGPNRGWPIRALTPIIAALLSIAATWMLLPNLTAPEIGAQLRSEMDAMNTSFTGRTEVEGCEVVGNNTAASDVTIIGESGYPSEDCVLEIRIDRVSVKLVPMKGAVVDDIEDDYASKDYLRVLRIWFPANSRVIIFVYQPGHKFGRQDVESQGKPASTIISTRYVLGEAD